jgi:mono/diheme cytochrome c family protein
MCTPDHRRRGADGARVATLFAAFALVVSAAALGTGCATSGKASSGAGVGGYGLGHTPTAEQIAGWNIDASPAGGLPPGSGSVAQGAALFAQKCVACHGVGGDGGPGGRLVGGAGTLATAKPMPTIGSFWPHATTVYDYIHRAMPLDMPGSLRPNEVYALTAYLLNRNGIIAADAVLDARSLAAVRMPNRAGFTREQTADDVRPSRCMEKCGP